LNIGAAARAMSNFGFARMRLINPYHVAYHEARSAVNAGGILESAEEFSDVASAVADCTLVVGTTAVGHRELQHSLRRLEYGGRLLSRHLVSGPAALLFGSEKFGLSNEDLSHCHWLIRIPTRDEHASMNLGQAVANCLYELSRDSRAVRVQPDPVKPATAEQVERFTAMLIEGLEYSGYVKDPVSNSTRSKIRRMVRRLDLPARDSDMWHGMLRQLLWKLKQ
jgi:tRNA/rRNA methyltransferase